MLNQNRADYPLSFFLGGGEGYLSREMPTTKIAFVILSSETVKGREELLAMGTH